MLFSIDTKVRGRFSQMRCGPSRRCARSASVALENFVSCPQKTFSTASVEWRCGAVALGRTYLLPPLSSGGALLVRPWPRFHTPLIEPDRQISRIRLVWGFLCQGGRHANLVVLYIPFFCSTRAASTLPSRPHISIAVAAQRRSRTALLQRRRRLVLDGREQGGSLPVIGWLAVR